MQLESGNALPKEDLIADLATDPKLKVSATLATGAKVIITDGTNDASVNADGHLLTDSLTELEMLQHILCELKQMNLHLKCITDEQITENDLC